MKEKIEAVIRTLESLTIPSTFDNLNKLFGCLMVLKDMVEQIEKDGKQNENTNA